VAAARVSPGFRDFFAKCRLKMKIPLRPPLSVRGAHPSPSRSPAFAGYLDTNASLARLGRHATLTMAQPARPSTGPRRVGGLSAWNPYIPALTVPTSASSPNLARQHPIGESRFQILRLSFAEARQGEQRDLVNLVASLEKPTGRLMAVVMKMIVNNAQDLARASKGSLDTARIVGKMCLIATAASFLRGFAPIRSSTPRRPVFFVSSAAGRASLALLASKTTTPRSPSWGLSRVAKELGTTLAAR